MTPSLRLTFGRLGARRLAVTAAVAAVLSLSACGQASAGAAAVVGNRRISVAQLQTATEQIASIVSQGSTVDQNVVLGWLIISPFAVDAAARNNVGASTDDAAQIFAQAAAAGAFKGKADPAALEAVRGVLALQNLQGQGKATITQPRAQAAYDQLVAQLKATHIVVNPRYGTFRSDQLSVSLLAGARLPLVQAQPDWQVPTAAATATATPTPTTTP